MGTSVRLLLLLFVVYTGSAAVLDSNNASCEDHYPENCMSWKSRCPTDPGCGNWETHCAGNPTARAQCRKSCNDCKTTSRVTNGDWTQWTPWSTCSSTCFSTRQRFCTAPIPQHGGRTCGGQNTESRSCTGGNCLTAVNGGWSDWSRWSICSSDCQHTRQRYCNNPEPKYGGSNCKGKKKNTESCTGLNCRDLIEGRTPKSVQTTNGQAIGTTLSPTDAVISIWKFYIAIGVIVCLVIVLVIVLAIFLQRKRNSSAAHQNETASDNEVFQANPPQNMDDNLYLEPLPRPRSDHVYEDFE